MDANAMDALPMHALFGTQILLDIHHVLRDMTGSPFMDLQATGRRVIATIDDYFKYSRTRHISNWPEQNDEVFREVSRFAKEWTQEDRVGKAIVKGVGNVRRRVEDGKPSGKFTTSVESCQIVDDEREKTRFGHSWRKSEAES